ncbi:MAG: IS66 family insertion sequence element accessory protein TnpB [Defluviitaleaceae bacterium]|nr:IS66 family insertion sequence element accessory protein TnpB [Defluviitaleaceae bacterium]
MNTREIASEYRKAQWTQIIQERVASGESISKYCDSRGIRRNRYFYWQRKLRELACKELLSEVKMNPNDGGRSTSGTSLAPGWALCEQSESEIEADTSSVIVEIGKFRIIVGVSTGYEHLEKVCRVLVSLC